MKNVFYYCFYGAFVKNLMKKLSISNKNVYGTFQDILYYKIFSMWNFLVLKWRLFQYMTKFLKNVSFIVIVTRLSWKALSKNYVFLIKVFKIQFNIYYIAEFYDHTFSPIKTALLSIQCKLKKSILIAKSTKPMPNTLWKGCYFLLKFLKIKINF